MAASRRPWLLYSVWSRLLGTLALVVVPAAMLFSVLAYSLYGAAVATLQLTQVDASIGSASTIHAWLDASGRSLANEAYAAGYLDEQRCKLLAEAFLRRNSGFSAVRFFDQSAAACAAGEAIDTDVAQSETAKAAADGGYLVMAVGARIWIVAGAAQGQTVLVIDEKALQERLFPYLAEETNAALVDGQGAVISADPKSIRASWLPSTFAAAAPKAIWRANDRLGMSAAFALAPIEGSALSLLMRFGDRGLNAARRRLVTLCASQLAMLGLLALVYAATIRRDVVHWIHGIELAARAVGADPESALRAPVAPNMPEELRSVAESFNAMADRVVERQHALVSSLDENRALMLEMHHRIKNSLQVIQSYLALIRRAAPRAETLPLARIEARVGVLAIAYRLALTPSGMRPIAAKPFVEEICAAAIGGLRRPRQRVAYAIAWDGELIVDRAIPLGLGLVEALIAAFSALEAGYVGVHMGVDNDGAVALRVESDAAPVEAGLPDKVMRGLANQLGATAVAGRAGDILEWHFRP